MTSSRPNQRIAVLGQKQNLRDAGGGVRFWVVNADAKASRATGSTHTLKVTLTPVHASKVPDGTADVLVTSELTERPI